MYGLIDTQEIYRIINYVTNVIFKEHDKRTYYLLLGTCSQETHLGRIKDNTPFKAGSGVMQFDRIGFDDVRKRTRETDKYRVLKVSGIDIDKCTYEMLEYNPLISVIFARLFYKLIPEFIPTTLTGQAKYWKQYYNTASGKGSITDYIENFNKNVLSEDLNIDSLI